MKHLRLITAGLLALAVALALALATDFVHSLLVPAHGPVVAGAAACLIVYSVANSTAAHLLGLHGPLLRAQAVETSQVGKREALADVIANVESDSCPFSSMAKKGKRPGNVEQSWQLQAYRRKGHRGVRDGLDATNFTSNGRDRITAIGQKTWDPRAVSDFAEETTVAGLKSGELAAQAADAFVTVKQTIERRGLSDQDCTREEEDNKDTANETRGMFSWLSPTEQVLHPVPEKFRPNANQFHNGALSTMKEDVLQALARAAWKRRMGNSVRIHGFVGIDLKAIFSNWTRYDDEVANKFPVRTFQQDAETKALVTCIDRLTFDSGTIELHPSAHIITDPDSGADTDYTHRSGVFVDMDMVELNYMRLPRAFRPEYKGGGHKVVVDAIFTWIYRNPAGGFSSKSNS